MCKKIFTFCSLIVLVSGFSGVLAAQELVKRALSPCHSGTYFESVLKQEAGLQGAAKKSADDYGVRLTFTSGSKEYLDWSPDGQWIAFDNFDIGNIWVIPSAGGAPFNLTEDINGFCFEPCFNAESNGITFTNYNSTMISFNLEFIDIDGGGHHILRPDALAGCWSHNGEYLAYRVFSTSELRLYDMKSGLDIVIGEGDSGYGRSCFSPDDEYVITSMVAKDGTSKLFSIPREGGEPKQLTFHEGNHDFPDYSPDGMWILYTDIDMLVIYAYNTETGESLLVFPDAIQWHYRGRFSPEGDRFCYLLVDLYYDDILGFEVFVTDFPFYKELQLTLLTPNGGEEFIAGGPLDITWTSSGVTNIRIEFSADGGSSWNVITDNVDASTGSYRCPAPEIESYMCLVRIIDLSGSGLEDRSDGYFSTLPPPHLRIISPNGGENWEVGSTYDITWESRYVRTVEILYSTDGGSSWIQIAAGVDASAQSYSWTVPDNPSSSCRVLLINEARPGVKNQSYADFTISRPEVKPTIRVMSPAGGEEWVAGSTQTITWQSSNVEKVYITYSTDGGSSWNLIASGVDASVQSYTWIVSYDASVTCRIRITDESDPQVFHTSWADFSILPKPFIRVISPNGGEVWEVRSTQTISWTAQGISRFRIESSFDNGKNWYHTDYHDADDMSVKTYYYTMIVPEGSQSSECLIKISDSEDATINDESDNVFTIIPAGEEAYITLIFPEGGEVLEAGSTCTIQWESSGVSYVDISFSPDGGETDYSIAEGVNASDSSCEWVIPDDIESEDCYIWIGDVDDEYIEDWNEEPFTITVKTPEPYITVISPNGGEVWEVGTQHTISWIAQGISRFRIESSFDSGKSWYHTDYHDADVIGAKTYYYTMLIPEGSQSSECLIKISDSEDATINDESDGVFTIIPAGEEAYITLISPIGGEVWEAGSTCTIQWESRGVSNVRILYSLDLGVNWFTITESIPADYSYYQWTVPSDTEAYYCYIWIEDTDDNSIYDESDDRFSIIPAAIEPGLELLYPNGGEEWKVGSLQNITWQSSGINEVRIEYSTDDGANWVIIVDHTDAATGTFQWDVPDVGESSSCRVKITATDDESITDISNDTFTISRVPFIQVIAPDGGEKWQEESRQTIQWTSRDVENVTIEYSSNGGGSWNNIADNVDASTGSYEWLLPEVVLPDCIIRIRDSSDADINDVSDGTFSIISSDYITITAPTSGDQWTVNSEKEIKWGFKGVENIEIALSFDDGSTWTVMAGSVSASTGSYSWTVPDTPSDRCRIRITDVANPDVTYTTERFEIIRPEVVIAHVPLTVAQENEPITFTATVTGTAEIASVTLNYDETGDRNFNNQVPMTLISGNQYSVTLDIGVFTAHGMEYYIIARDVNSVESRSPADVGFYSIRSRVTDIRSTQQIIGGSVRDAYRMISIPLNLTRTTIVDQMMGRLPGNSGTDWRLFRYTPGSGTPDEYPDIEGFSPGIAFWLITRENFVLVAPEGTTVTTDEPFTFMGNKTLKWGWNDIANPWMFDISWDNIENPSGAELSVLYTYEGKWSDPTNPPKILEPWKGYAVKNMENRNVIIRLLPLPAQSSKPAVKKDTELWKLTIKASAGAAVDEANHLGVRYDAEVEWDCYDHVEPPPVGEYVSVSFPHYDWGKYPYEYTVDFRPPDHTISWDFTVKTNISRETVDIELVGVEHLPEGLSLKVFDCDSDRRIAAQDNTFSFVSANGLTERHFRLVVSDSSEPEPEQDNPRPERFVTANCYPNPFNPRTLLRYELSMAGKVCISVFNSLGQTVRVYEPGYKDKGVHELVFDAEELTSGLYIYRIDAGYASVTGKMLYMK